ncbi:hypothetical protein HDU99_001069, partial [Rhizoclosmatium hyalinum]
MIKTFKRLKDSCIGASAENALEHEKNQNGHDSGVVAADSEPSLNFQTGLDAKGITALIQELNRRGAEVETTISSLMGNVSHSSGALVAGTTTCPSLVAPVAELSSTCDEINSVDENALVDEAMVPLVFGSSDQIVNDTLTLLKKYDTLIQKLTAKNNELESKLTNPLSVIKELESDKVLEFTRGFKSELLEIAAYSKSLKDLVDPDSGAEESTFSYKTHPHQIVITDPLNGGDLSEAEDQKGTTPFRPDFPHNSTISIRAWSSKKKDFVRIRLGEGVLDDTPLLAISHIWRFYDEVGKPVEFIKDSLPAPGYTQAIFKAVQETRKDLQINHLDYYVWLDFLCTNQLNPLEVREATMKMSWIYATAFATVVILDVNLPDSDLDASFWSRRVWAMQEEYLSKELVFFDRHGSKKPVIGANICLPVIRETVYSQISEREEWGPRYLDQNGY